MSGPGKKKYSADNPFASSAKTYSPDNPFAAKPVESDGAGRTWEVEKRFTGPQFNPAGFAAGLQSTARALAHGVSGGVDEEVVGTLRGILPGGKTPAEAIKEERAKTNALPAPARAAGDIVGMLYGTSKLGKALESAPMLGRILANGGVAAVTAAGSNANNSVKDALTSAALAAPVGAGLGYGFEKALGANATRALTTIGGAAGASQGHGFMDRTEKGALGAAGGYGLARGGAKLGAKAASAFGLDGVLQTVEDRGLSKLGKALGRAGIKEEAIAAAGKEGIPGTTILEVDKPGGPIVRLGAQVARIPSTGGAKLGEFVGERAALAPSSAEKYVKRALGSKYEAVNPKAAAIKTTVSAEAAPHYEAAYGHSVSGEILSPYLTEPRFKQALERGLRLAKLEGEDIPDNLDFNGQVPVKVVDYWKQGLDEVIQSGKQKGGIASKEAKALRKKLNEMVSRVDEQVPEYKEARRVYGEAAQRQREGLTKQKLTADHIRGNSRTMQNAKDEADFGESVTMPKGLNLLDMLTKFGGEKVAGHMRGLDEATADALAPYLMKDLTNGGADDLIQALKDYAAREGERRARLGAVPRAASAAIGLGSASALHPRQSQ